MIMAAMLSVHLFQAAGKYKCSSAYVLHATQLLAPIPPARLLRLCFINQVKGQTLNNYFQALDRH